MSDQDQIQGTWQVTAGERAGKGFPEDVVNSAQLVFDADKMTTRVKNRTTTFKFKLSPDQAPKHIDLDMDGTPGLGIYKLVGDTLTIVHSEAGQDRPKEFATDAGTPLTMMTLRRVPT
jgi:uncharacterized protein (TIGR03067 family)